MQLDLKVPPGKTLEALCGDMAKGILQAVIDTFKQDLSAVYFASLRHELYEAVCSWFHLTPATAPKCRAVQFASLEEYGRFQADLTGIALSHIGAGVGKEHAIALIARGIPQAITATLEPWLGHADAPPVAGIVRSPQDQWDQFASG